MHAMPPPTATPLANLLASQVASLADVDARLAECAATPAPPTREQRKLHVDSILDAWLPLPADGPANALPERPGIPTTPHAGPMHLPSTQAPGARPAPRSTASNASVAAARDRVAALAAAMEDTPYANRGRRR